MADSVQIAIDGPVAAGKGTVSRLVAERLGFLYVDTGAMYRAVALLCHRQKIELDPKNLDQIVTLINKSNIELQNPTPEQQDGRLTTVLLNGEDISWQIRTPIIDKAASKIANFAPVRKCLVVIQQKIANNRNVVMEGRDTTYRVLPDAQLKIYLTANEVVRAKRRHFEQLLRGQDVSYETTLQEIQKRDLENTTRQVDPLKIVPEAWVIDTSDLAIDKVVDIICQRVSFMTR